MRRGGRRGWGRRVMCIGKSECVGIDGCMMGLIRWEGLSMVRTSMHGME